MDTKWTVLLQSNYFREAKELYLKFSSIRAFDKDKCKVVLNLNNLSVVKCNAPRLKIISIEEKNGVYEIKYSIKLDPQRDLNRTYDVIYSEFTDESGKIYNISSSNISDNSDGKNQGTIVLPKENYNGNVIFTITDYPERIYKVVSIRVK